jgi:predicted dehydrogenase
MQNMELTHRALMVGCGKMSEEWLRNSKELGVQIVGLVDINSEAAAAKARELEIDAPVFTDLDQALSKAGANMLFDCTIPAAHVEVGLKGLQAGLHVLQEKPMATTLEDGRRLLKAAQKSGRVHAIMQNRRFHHGMRKIRQLIAEGYIGDLTTINVDFFIGAHFGGFREKMDHILLTDQAIHHFDQIRFLSGANATRVYCDEWNPIGSWYQHGASAHAIFHLGEGIRATFRGSWCSEGLRTSWEAEFRLIGTRGTILYDGYENIRGEQVSKAEGFLYEQKPFGPLGEPESSETRGHYSVIRQFLRDVEGHGQAETRSTDNIHSLAMVFGAIESADRGQPVAILD